MGAGSEATIAGDDWLGSSPDRRGGPEKDVMSFGKIPSALLLFFCCRASAASNMFNGDSVATVN